MDYKYEKDILWNLVIEYKEQIDSLNDTIGDKSAIIKALQQ